MPHYPHMLGRDFVECLRLDGWSIEYTDQRGGSPPTRALAKKEGHEARAYTLMFEMSDKRVEAAARSAGISAQRLEELRLSLRQPVPAAATARRG